MREFSPDGFWWWDGASWRPSTEIELTPPTEFERSGKLEHARGLIRNRDNAFAGSYAASVVPGGALLMDLAAIYVMVVQWRAFKEYREWSLEQLKVATEMLFGADEPMVAGETTLWPPSGFVPGMRRDFAVAATRSHVVLYQFATADSPTMRVVFAADAAQVRLTQYGGIMMANLGVFCGGRRWELQGIKRIFNPWPVMAAWQSASAAKMPA
ncbi:MAG TPA: hypothetical protein VFL29_10235 [Candidatus Dormibacteraeota bacterium]|nr:hypothetical protein [Candidatus Dormibacteraeota bacterium]